MSARSELTPATVIISAVFLGIESVGEKRGCLLEERLANGEFAVVLFPAVSAHG